MTTIRSPGGQRVAGCRAWTVAATLVALLAPPALPAAQPGGMVLGVLPFAHAPGDTVLGHLSYALADLLATDLATSRRIRLVERLRFGEVLRELALSATDVVDEATAPRAGRLLRATTLVTGSLRGRGAGDVAFGVGVTDVGTGRVERARDRWAAVAELLDAEKALAFEILARLGVQLTPAERERIEQRPTRSLAALLAYGQGVRAEIDGRYAAAARAFRRAVTADPTFRAARDRLDAARADASRRSSLDVAARAGAAVNPSLPVVPVTPRVGLPVDPALPALGPGTVTVRISRP